MLKVEDLTKHFPVGQGLITSRFGKTVKAVDGVSFEVNEGDTLGLVGESGCGKSTTGRCINKLLEATAGQIHYGDVNVRTLRGKQLKAYRRDVQFIFQDPYASLNPRMTFGEIMAEPLVIHSIGTRKEREGRCKEMLERVGLNPEHIHRYPHEFSGGQRQRVGIARALMLRPKMIICDEPVSALDVSIQAQIINLLEELQDEFKLTYLFIAHDLAVIRHICDNVAVMYLGKIVERGGWRDVYNSPHHPYTQSLLSAAPVPDPERQRERSRIILTGDVPSPIDPPTGCHFHTRCPIAQFPICSEQEPELKEVGTGHWAACHFAKAFPIPEGAALLKQFDEGDES
ncbi:dipeptide ABC transporter ATP-binding protein [Candidatus Fermentibacteria bacterium]|nr:dipeptide ABC transporter ATP-binding protein [Candidatus Fermentibacteria bacterium]